MSGAESGLELLTPLPWRVWTFYEDLCLEPPQDGRAEEVPGRGTDIVEEGLETLWMLNLDRLHPHFALRLCEKSHHEWAGADVVATDPSGCLHLFEMKYAMSARHVAAQAFSYALASPRLRLGWFDQQPVELRRQFLQRRIAGFWERVHSDKTWPWTQTLPVVCDKYARFVGDHLHRLVASRKRAVADRENVKCARDMHVHLVVPDAKEIGSEGVEMLARALYRQGRVSVREVRIRLERSARRGRLYEREVLLKPRAEKKSYAPERSILPLTGLIAQLHLDRPDLHFLAQRQQGATWWSENYNLALFRWGHLSFVDGLGFRWQVTRWGSPTETITAGDANALRIVSDWLAEELEPEDREARRRLRQTLSKLDWDVRRDGLGIHVYRAAGTFVRISVQGSPTSCARVFNGLFDSFQRWTQRNAK